MAINDVDHIEPACPSAGPAYLSFGIFVSMIVTDRCDPIFHIEILQSLGSDDRNLATGRPAPAPSHASPRTPRKGSIPSFMP